MLGVRRNGLQLLRVLGKALLTTPCEQRWSISDGVQQVYSLEVGVCLVYWGHKEASVAGRDEHEGGQE